MVRGLSLRFVPPPNEPWEPYFRLYLEDIWQRESKNLRELEAADGSHKAIADTRISLFIFAVGLVTYGCLEVIPFMLRNIPQAGKLPRLARVALELLPVPEEVMSARDWELVAKWVEEHYDELEWDEEAEKFVFKR
jgi:hypothetical protein